MQETTDQATLESEVNQPIDQTILKDEDESNDPYGRGRKGFKSRFIQFNPDGDWDLDKWKSIFLSHNDPTEYKAALELIGSWKEWLSIKKNWPSFNDYLQEWHEELQVKLRSDAVTALVLSTKEAAKLFIAKGQLADVTKVNRTKKVRQTGFIKKSVEDEDFNRVMQVLGD